MSLYTLIIKAVIMMLEKGKDSDKIQFVVNQPANSIEEKLSKYRAYCILKIDGSPTSSELLSSAEWNKDRKKKNIKLPEFNSFNKASKFFTITPEYKVLIEDKNVEFLIRNKVLENFLKAIVMRFDISDLDATPMFSKFNEHYDTIMNNIDYSKVIQVLEFYPEIVSI